MLYITLGVIAIYFAIKFYLDYVFSYWNKKEVPVPNFRYPFGHILDAVLLKKNIATIYAEIYKKFPGYNYVGIYKCLNPGIIVRSPELVKNILSTDFNSFYDNDFEVDDKNDLITGKNAFFVKAPKWKTVRNQATPTFSPIRIKAMFPLVEETCSKLVKYLDSIIESSNPESQESKELCSKYTCENVASCAFGFDGHSFINENAPIRELGKKIVQPSFITGLKHLCIFTLPTVAKHLNVKFFPDDMTDFVRKMVADTIAYRKANNLIRNDVIDVLLEQKKKINDDKIFGDEDVVAHAGGFLLDGLETTSTAMCFMMYEIAANSRAQEILRKEVDEAFERNGGKITYDDMLGMKYLDCIVKESLRMHPPLQLMLKVCSKDYEMPSVNEDGTGLINKLEAGTSVIIPMYAIQMDEKYFPEPEKFIPERHNDENKDNIIKCTFLPFGEGPRMCVGMRFGLLESKMMIITLVRNYIMSVNKSKTQEPLVVDPKSFLTTAVGGMWLNFEKRK